MKAHLGFSDHQNLQSYRRRLDLPLLKGRLAMQGLFLFEIVLHCKKVRNLNQMLRGCLLLKGSYIRVCGFKGSQLHMFLTPRGDDLYV